MQENAGDVFLEEETLEMGIKMGSFQEAERP